MRTRTLSVVLCAFAILVSSEVVGQMVFRQGGGDGPSDVVMLRELGIIAAAEGDSDEVRVMMILPDADQKIPLKKGDLVLMVDGKRVRDVATLREAYENAAIGDTVKVGIRRGDERFLTSFEKEEEPEGEMRMVVAGGPGMGHGDMQPLHEFGAVLGEADGEVIVIAKLPMDGAVLEQDDVVRSINGHAVSSIEEFRKAYESVDVGDEVSIVFLRGNEEIDASRTKAEARGKVMSWSH